MIKKSKYSKDKHFTELLKGSSITFIFRILGMGLGYLFTLVIARWYGAETMGLYALSLTLLNIFVTLGMFGFDNALVKFIADYSSNEKEYLSKEVYLKVLTIVIPIGLLLTFALYISSNYLSTVIFKKEHLIVFLHITALGVLPFILLRINSTLFRALKKIKLYAFFDTLGIYLVSLILLIILTYVMQQTKSFLVIAVQMLSILALMIISCIYVKKDTNLFKTTSKNILEYKNIFKVSFPMLLTSSMALVMGWTDIVMLGMFRSESEVGVYSVLVKLASLTSISLLAVNSIAAPKFAELYSKKDMLGFKKVAQSSTKMIFFSSLPIILILSLFSKHILSIFGDEFIIGYVALWILMAGQTISAMSGSVGVILNMTGNEIVFQKLTFFMTILNIIFNIFLIPEYGIIGASLSTMISLSVWNIASVLIIKNKLKFTTLIHF